MESLKELIAEAFKKAVPLAASFELSNNPITLTSGAITVRYNGMALAIIAPSSMQMERQGKDIRVLCVMGDMTTWWYENRLTDIGERIKDAKQAQLARQAQTQQAQQVQGVIVAKHDATPTVVLPNLLVVALPVAMMHIIRYQHDPYTCLGISRVNGQPPPIAIVQQQYRRLAARFHPDKCADAMATEVFKVIASAARTIVASNRNA